MHCEAALGNALFFGQCNFLIRDVTVTGVTVNYSKIPDGEAYRLNFNYHGNRCGR